MTKWMVAYDGSDASKRALDVTAELSNGGDSVMIFKCFTAPSHDLAYRDPRSAMMHSKYMHNKQFKEIDAMAKARSQQSLEAAQTQYCAHGKGTVTIENHESPDCGEAILTAIEQHQSEVVVMGRRGLGKVSRMLLGSISSYLLYNTRNVDILIVK